MRGEPEIKLPGSIRVPSVVSHSKFPLVYETYLNQMNYAMLVIYIQIILKACTNKERLWPWSLMTHVDLLTGFW